MEQATVTYESRGGIGYITLNRPDKLNAISDEMSAELAAAFYQFDDDADAVVGIVSGNGRAFCSGADVRQRQMQTPEELRRIGGPGGRSPSITTPLYRSTNFKPLIAAVHGYVLGAGLLVALLADLLVAGEDARFQITEVRRGVNAGQFAALVAHRSSRTFADDVSLTGRYWAGAEAHSQGMAHYLAKPGEHLQIAEEVAAEIQKNPPLSVRALVRERRARLEAVEVQAYSTRTPNLYLTDDFRESALAFVEKRAPVFRGS